MYDRFPEITGFSQRHELDLLDWYEGVDTSPAQSDELPAMVALARTAVPGVTIRDATVERVYRQHPESVFPFRCGGRIAGGVAFLYLSENGLDRLLLDELDFSDPDPEVLVAPGEAPAAIYIWALAARGRAAGGIANVAARLREEPFGRADFYAQPSTRGGARILAQVGFEPTSSFQRNLWTYRRLCNRVPAQPQAALGCVA
jgi:hypothetical protein